MIYNYLSNCVSEFSNKYPSIASLNASFSHQQPKTPFVTIQKWRNKEKNVFCLFLINNLIIYYSTILSYVVC